MALEHIFRDKIAMRISEEQLDKNEQKKKIRERYKGVDQRLLKSIIADEEADVFDEEVHSRVAVYCRVSTGDPKQTSSYELQKNYYEDFVKHHPNWALVDIYADEGISGTSLKHREEFKRLIADCHAGKIDLIIVKSVSRFARNIVDCISQVRDLIALDPPVGVYFEVEAIYTRKENSEMALSFIATMAQEESHSRSTLMNSSIEMRFKHGLFLTPKLLGYDHDEEGNLIINEKEAIIVRLIFFMYLYGISISQIAENLTNLGFKTKKGNTQWSTSSIMQILQNERHCGDVRARKTYTPNYLDHKPKKNTNKRNQYIQENHHEAIISRDDFQAVQRMIHNSKYGGKGFLPELRVIDKGSLKGFVYINPIWAGFKAEDYFIASNSVFTDQQRVTAFESYEADEGDFDLRTFEIARGEFFNTVGRTCVTISSKEILFTQKCLKKLKSEYVELLIDPVEKLMVVHPSKKTAKHSMKWCMLLDRGRVPKGIHCAAFLPTLFEILGWNKDCKYRAVGAYIEKADGCVLLFDMSETEMIIPKGVPLQLSDEQSDQNTFEEHESNVVAYPESWSRSFGSSFYRVEHSKYLFTDVKDLDSDNAGYVYSNTPPLNVTDRKEIEETLKNIDGLLKEADDE